MIFFLYGRDGFRLKQNLDKIINEYRHKETENFSVYQLNLLDGDGINLLTDLFRIQPFQNEKRILVAKSPFKYGQEVLNLVKKWQVAVDKKTAVIFVENRDRATIEKEEPKLFAFLTIKPVISKEFQPLKGQKLTGWIRGEVEKRACVITPSALAKLIDYSIGKVGPNAEESGELIWLLGQEIEKLTSFKAGEGEKTITESDINLLIQPAIEANIFKLVDSVAAKNRACALMELEKQLDSDADPHYLLSMMAYQFRNLLKVKSLVKEAVPYPQIIKRTGLGQFVAKKTFEQCRRFELDELKKSFEKIAQLDIESKTGAVNIGDGLYQLVCDLTSYH